MLNAGLFQPVGVTHQLEPLHHGLFDDALAVGYRMQLRMDGEALHGEGLLVTDIVLPGQGLDIFKQLVKALGRKISHAQQHALAAAQHNIGTGAGALVAGEQHAAVFGLHLFKTLELQFVGHQAFHAHQAGNRKTIHIKKPPVLHSKKANTGVFA